MWIGATTVEVEMRPEIFFTGRPRAGAMIQCYGLFGSLLSFENVATRIALQLSDRFDDVVWHDYRHREPPTEGPFADRLYLDPKAPIAVYHGVAYTELRTALAGHRFRIGCFVCDADVVEPAAVAIYNDCFDLVVVPSAFCRDVFRRSGVRAPILIVPHGVGDEFHPCEDEAKPELFTFYNVYSQSRRYRKSEQELVRAFMRAFDRDPAIQLRLRTSMNPKLRALLEAEDAEDVVHIDADPLPGLEYARRYCQVHTTVHPSKAEGFGMVPLQSLACETPVMAPAITGLVDYLNADNAMLLRTAGMVEALGDTARDAGGRYYGIDEAYLAQCMRDMADNWQTERQKAVYAGPYIREHYAWDRVLAPLMEIVQQQLDRPGSKLVLD